MTSSGAIKKAVPGRCVVCGHPIVNDATLIHGVYGRGNRHADYSICMANAFNAPKEDS